MKFGGQCIWPHQKIFQLLPFGLPGGLHTLSAFLNFDVHCLVNLVIDMMLFVGDALDSVSFALDFVVSCFVCLRQSARTDIPNRRRENRGDYAEHPKTVLFQPFEQRVNFIHVYRLSSSSRSPLRATASRPPVWSPSPVSLLPIFFCSCSRRSSRRFDTGVSCQQN